MYFFRVDGGYAAFASSSGYLFTPDCDYLGWIERDDSAWRVDGSYLGEVVDGSYILRRSAAATPARRARRARPGRPARPARPARRAARGRRAGWNDALADVG